MHSGLELRALVAGYLITMVENMQFLKLVSTEGFDIHTHNAKLFGIYDGQGTRKNG